LELGVYRLQELESQIVKNGDEEEEDMKYYLYKKLDVTSELFL
jgi:hypothetical protein